MTDAGGSDPTADTAADADEGATGEPTASGAGDDVAVVTIGGETFEIDVTPTAVFRCDPAFFGAFWALGGDDTARIELLLPPPDDPNFADQPPTITVELDDRGIKWIADGTREMAGVEPGGSQVDDFSVDGNTVTGTATFADLNESYAFQGGVGDPPESITGSFSVSCSGA